MIDLTTIDDDTLMARGSYATVRGALEDEKKALSILCGELSSVSSKVLHTMQPQRDAIPESVDALITMGRGTLDAMEACAKRIESLSHQKQGLKMQAWGRK